MNALLKEWNPAAVDNLQKEMGSFRNRALCGGYAVDQWVGRNTRPHGDIDVGVFRSELRDCLAAYWTRARIPVLPAGNTYGVGWRGGA